MLLTFLLGLAVGIALALAWMRAAPHRRLQRAPDASAQHVVSEALSSPWSLIDRLPVSVSVLDEELRYVWLNEAVARYLGEPRDALLGRRASEIVLDPAWKEVYPRYQQAWADQVNVQFEAYAPSRARWLLHHVLAAPGGVVAIVDDVTERHESQLRLAESQAALRRSVESDEAARAELQRTMDRISDAVIGLDREWRITFANRFAEQLLGASAHELAQGSFWLRFPAAAATRAELETALAAQVPLVTECHDASVGLWYHCRLFPSPDGPTLFLSDITERRAAEHSAREARLRLELAIQASGIGIWDWDLQRDHLWIRFSAKRQEIDSATFYEGDVGQWMSRIHPEDRHDLLEKRDAHVRDRTPAFEAEFRTMEVDGLWHWTYVSAAAVFDEKDNPVRLLGIHLDITDRKRDHVALLDSREQMRGLAAAVGRAREAERTRVAREIHDELGQALSLLHMDLDWSLRHIPPELERVVGRLHDMRSVVQKTSQTVRRIASELRPGVLDDLGLSAAVQWQAREFEERSRHQVSLSVDTLPPLHPEAATAIFRILQESLTNVSKHAEAGRVEISLVRQGDGIELRVADDGRGLTAARGDRAPRESFGLLGMSERTQSWGGRVDVSERPTGGTEVRAWFPLARIAKDVAPGAERGT